MEWKSAIENYKSFLILERSLSNNSVEAYLNDINKLANFCVERYKIKKPEAAKQEMLNEFVHLLSENGVTARTQARSISSIRSFFKYLAFDGVIKDDPSKLLVAPKVGRKVPTVLSSAEVDAIENAVEMYKPEGQRNRAIIEILYSCGLRVSELIGLKLSNINFRSNTVKIEGKGNKERLVPLSKKAKNELKKYFAVYRDYLDIDDANKDIVFLNKHGKALSRVMVFNIIKYLAKRAGVKKSISPHTFRHSFATALVQGGADLRAVQGMLGHESILTTEIYTLLDNSHLKETVYKYHPRSSQESAESKGAQIAKPATKPVAKVAPKPAAKPVAKATAKPVAKATPKPAVKATAKKAPAKKATKPATKPAPKAAAKAKPAVKTATKPVAKTTAKKAPAKKATKPAAKPATKATKPAAKPAPKAAAKAKPAVKTATKPIAKKAPAKKAPAKKATKPVAKPAVKPATKDTAKAKPAVKTAAKPAAKKAPAKKAPAKSATKSEKKPATKAVAKPVAKTAAKGATAKKAPKTVKSAVKAKPAVKSATKPAAK